MCNAAWSWIHRLVSPGLRIPLQVRVLALINKLFSVGICEKGGYLQMSAAGRLDTSVLQHTTSGDVKLKQYVLL